MTGVDSTGPRLAGTDSTGSETMQCSGLLSFVLTYALLESEDDLGLDSARVREQVGHCSLDRDDWRRLDRQLEQT